MSKIPTANEILSKYSDNYKSAAFKDRAVVKGEHAIAAMIEFGKIQAKAALDAASEKARFNVRNHDGYVRDITDNVAIPNPEQEYGGSIDIHKDSILDAYPLNLIK